MGSQNVLQRKRCRKRWKSTATMLLMRKKCDDGKNMIQGEEGPEGNVRGRAISKGNQSCIRRSCHAYLSINHAPAVLFPSAMHKIMSLELPHRNPWYAPHSDEITISESAKRIRRSPAHTSASGMPSSAGTHRIVSTARWCLWFEARASLSLTGK